MTLGEFRTKTKGLSDDYNLILSIYSEDAITEVDSMGVEIDNGTMEVKVLN